ncbi:hypothetical protein DFS34DRAFT_644311 [Phlyctochytrium arcticum]|nr:hypothetical protein DFS34DRAFT_644311 [Phlyctochytrium arcticum]
MPLELPCDQCEEVFLTLSTRQRHIRIKHRNSLVSQESHPSPPLTPPPAAAPAAAPTTTNTTATKKTAATKPTAPTTTTNTTTPKTASKATEKTAAPKFTAAPPPTTTTTNPKTIANATKKAVPPPTTKTQPKPTIARPSPPANKQTHEEERKSRLAQANRLYDGLGYNLPTPREHFVAELMSIDPNDPGFCIYIPKGAKDVSEVQGYYRGLSRVPPLTTPEFRQCVNLLVKNPFTKPHSLTTNLLAFEIHLESVCNGFVSKKARSMRTPMLYWSYALSEIARRTLVFMALQDAAAIDKRIKYSEEMVKFGYHDMLVVFESKLDAKRAEDVRPINSGQSHNDLTADPMNFDSLEQLLQTIDAQMAFKKAQKK